MSASPLFSSYRTGENRVTGSMLAVFERIGFGLLEEILRIASRDLDVPLVEAIDAGEDRLVVRFAGAVRGKTSGVETAFDYWVVGTFHEGRILSQLWFSTRASAFEAVGLTENTD